MTKTTVGAVVTLAFLTVAGPLAAQGQVREGQGFSVEFAAGVVGVDEFDQTQLAIGINPRWCWEVRRAWCWWIDIWWIDGPWRDPWRGIILIDDIPVPVSDLDVGPGIMFAPAIEYRFESEGSVTPSFYVGAGVQRDEGATTQIPAVGSFTTDSTTSPVVIFGAAFTYDLSDRTAVRFGVGGSMLFMGDMDIRGPDGSNFNVDGDETLSGVLSVGVDVRF